MYVFSKQTAKPGYWSGETRGIRCILTICLTPSLVVYSLPPMSERLKNDTHHFDVQVVVVQCTFIKYESFFSLLCSS